MRKLLDASIILALFTSLLYISGETYSSSYLREWGIEPSLISSSTHDILIKGASVWFIGSVYVIVIITLLSFLLLPSFYLILEVSKFPITKKIAVKAYGWLKRRKIEKEPPPAFFQAAIKYGIQFFSLVVFLSIFLFLLYHVLDYSSSQAETDAQNDYKRFSGGTFIVNRLFSQEKVIKTRNQKMRGYIVANSESLMVLYIPKSDRDSEGVSIIPIKSIISISASKSRI